MSDLRSLERRLAVIEGRITPHTDRARRGLQHRYVSVPPIGDAYLSGTFTKMATVATVDRQINLYPLHLTRPMELRRVTLVAGAADTLQFATAIYRAGPVSDEKAALLSGTPGSRVTWQLLASCGTTAVGAGSASQTYDHDLSVDVDLDDGLLLYLAVMIGSSSTTKLYLPAQSYVGGDGFVADAVGTTLGKWPDTLGAQSGVRAEVPYFILRSALGVRLFGDPLPTAVPASSVSVVSSSRAINTTAPLAGGGDLSADRTLSISAATSGAAGSMSAADKSKLDGITAGAAVASVSGTAPIVSSGGTTPTISATTGYAASTLAAGNDLRLGFFRARLATTAALPSCTYSSGVLTATANGALSVDSKTVNASDIILVYQQTTATNNGLYTVTATGSAGTPWVLTRHTALNTSTQWTNGLMFYAWDGTATTGNLRKWFVCTNTGAITLDTTNLTFAEAFLSSLSTASAIYESGGTTLSIAGIADGEILYRTGSAVDGIATGVSGGVALYADERFDDLTDTINFVTANSGATDLTGNGIFQGITGSGGGSNGTSRYGRYRRNTTGAVSGNTQYQSNTVTDAYLQMGPRLIFKQAISRTTNIRAFVGYSTASAPQGMSADDTAGATIGFQYSTPRGDTSIRFIWDDGTTQGTDSTGVSFTADVPLVFVIDWDRVNAKVTGRIYSTSGSAWSQVYSKTQSTGLPADSTSFYIGAGVQTQAASAVYIDTYYWRAKIRGL